MHDVHGHLQSGELSVMLPSVSTDGLEDYHFEKSFNPIELFFFEFQIIPIYIFDCQRFIYSTYDPSAESDGNVFCIIYIE